MKKLLIAFGLSTAALIGVYAFPAEAQVQCQPGYDRIVYYMPYPNGPVSGTEVFYCDGHSTLIGRLDAYEDITYCNWC
ncbi:MAG: hypothetical protein E6G92_14050 [Alphaproteobacteria bacterium]|nr:MAG: hypothetical protein E6G92_14050 [Alphaproteobacteria bacterium]